MMPQDVIKLCYQAAFGAEHLLADISAARRYFDSELASVDARDGELFEMISDKVCRVDLGVWKKKNLPPERLFEAFVASARVEISDKECFFENISIADEIVKANLLDFSQRSAQNFVGDPSHDTRGGALDFTLDEWRDFLAEYKEKGMGAVHHSPRYRENEKPAYRIVLRELIEE